VNGKDTHQFINGEELPEPTGKKTQRTKKSSEKEGKKGNGGEKQREKK